MKWNVESTENVKELALKIKIKGREIKQNSQWEPLKPCCDRVQKAPRTGPLNNNIVISSQMGASAQFTCDLYVNCGLFFFSSEIPDAYSSQKVPKKTTVHSNMPL